MLMGVYYITHPKIMLSGANVAGVDATPYLDV